MLNFNSLGELKVLISRARHHRNDLISWCIFFNSRNEHCIISSKKYFCAPWKKKRALKVANIMAPCSTPVPCELKKLTRIQSSITTPIWASAASFFTVHNLSSITHSVMPKETQKLFKSAKKDHLKQRGRQKGRCWTSGGDDGSLLINLGAKG